WTFPFSRELRSEAGVVHHGRVLLKPIDLRRSGIESKKVLLETARTRRLQIGECPFQIRLRKPVCAPAIPRETSFAPICPHIIHMENATIERRAFHLREMCA